MMKENKIWFYILVFLFLLMGMSTLKISYIFTFKVYQIIIPMLFIIFILIDLRKKTLNINLILFLFGFGVLLSLISLNSVYEKIGEIKFIIKYVILFPASFYIGYKFIEKISIKELVKTYDIFMVFNVIVAILFLFYPIEFLYHRRGETTSFQGMFWEPSGLGMALGGALLGVLSLRYEFKIIPKNMYLYSFFYMSIIFSILFAKTKAFWFATFSSLIVIVFQKIIIFIKYYYRYNINLKNMKFAFIWNIKVKYILIILIIIPIVLFTANSLMESPFISKEIIQEKLQSERGKAFTVAIELLKNSHWLGGYGWGFIESYFGSRNLGIIGLGEGISMIFNSYLNEWISVGIVGLIFHLILLKLSYSKNHLYTMVIPLYLFFLANVHPLLGSEEYYFTLGLSYGLKSFYKN